MDYPSRVGCVFGFVLFLDICWIGCNRFFRGIYHENFASLSIAQNPLVLVGACLGCWLQTALFLCYEQHETPGMAFGRGAWTGSLVYGVFNLTTYSLFDGWRKSWQTGVGDTLWGTFLFGLAALVSHGLEQ